MSCAYNELYLYDAMRNLGEMTEYAHDACGIDPDRALQFFVISGYSDSFGKGDPFAVSGMSGTELFMAIATACGMNDIDWPDALIRYETEEYYWIGYILAYYQWSVNIPFRLIINTVKAADLLRLYPTLHTESEENAIQVIRELYNSRSQFNRLQEYRKRLGMTQSELAASAGINLRTLQQYESGAKSLNKAASESVLSLAGVLHCDIRDLVL